MSTTFADALIVWDVGQGSWATLVIGKHCIHFDMGGQTFPNTQKLKLACGAKKNSLALSHLDADHVRFIRKASRLFSLCLIDKASFPKHTSISALPNCSTVPAQLRVLNRSLFRKKNESHIYIWDQLLLAPGDAYKSQELKLSAHAVRAVRFLIVGHHGSKTSSHPQLLKKLPNLHQGLVSARKSKYGHPHPRTLQTFKRFQKPIVTTDSFGTLIYEL